MQFELKEKKVNEARCFDFRGYDHLLIGDPDYLDRISTKTDDGKEKELVADIYIKDSDKYFGKCIIRELCETYDTPMGEMPVEQVEVMFFVTKSVQGYHIVKQLLNKETYPKSELKKFTVLGCDTASFEVFINDRYCHFDTGADGAYGYAYTFRNDEAIVIGFTLDAGLFPLDEVENDIRDLFRDLII